jgi:hypothetical protein
VDTCRRTGQELPEKILNRPALDMGLHFYLSAWEELSYDRPVGFGAGPIPSASFRSYIRDVGMDDDDAERFHFIVRRMDNFYVEHANKKDK